MIFNSADNLFLPIDLNTILVWLDGNDPNANNTTPTGSSNLSIWKDKSRNGFNFSQSTGVLQPVNINSFRNHLNIVSFGPNSNTYLDTSTTINVTADFSLLFAMQFDGVTSNGYVFDPSTTSTTPELFANAASSNFAIGEYNGSASRGAVTTPVAAGVFYIFTYTYDSTGSAKLWRNGVSQGSTTTSSYSAAGNISRRIGSNANAAAAFRGKIGDIVIASGVWSDADRRRMEIWSGTKWGVSI